jgi:hypothetical protein
MTGITGLSSIAPLVSEVLLAQTPPGQPTSGSGTKPSGGATPASSSKPAAQICPVDIESQVTSLKKATDFMMFTVMLLSFRYMIEIKGAQNALKKRKNPEDALSTAKLKDVVKNIAHLAPRLKKMLARMPEARRNRVIRKYLSTANKATLTATSDYYFGFFKNLAKVTNKDRALNNPDIKRLLNNSSDKALEAKLTKKLIELYKASRNKKAKRILKFMMFMTMLLSVKYMIEVKGAQNALKKRKDPEGALSTAKLKDVIKNIAHLAPRLKKNLAGMSEARRNRVIRKPKTPFYCK